MIPRRIYAALAQLRAVNENVRKIGSVLDTDDLVACATQVVLPAFDEELKSREPGCMTITLCGSTRFERVFDLWNHALSLSGHSVFGLGSRRGAYLVDGAHRDEQEAILDRSHRRKIDQSDAIVVVNPFAYVGDSTLGEIAYAREAGIAVYAVESWGKGCGVWYNGHADATRESARCYRVPEAFVSPINLVHGKSARSVWHLLPDEIALRAQIVGTIRAFERLHLGRIQTIGERP